MSSMCVCLCVSRVGSSRPKSCDGLSSGQPVDRRVHMGVVTSRQCYVNPLMVRGEVRLANPRKTKVLSVRLDGSSTTAAPAA